MNKKIGIAFGILIAGVIILAIAGVFKSDEQKALEADVIGFAECLKEEGAKFYGAFWCPHCQNQKRIFGKKASDSLPYVECSTPDGENQTEVCKEAGIESYPTWEFADGTRKSGEQSIQELSRQTSCPITPAMAEFYKVEETAAVLEGLNVEVQETNSSIEGLNIEIQEPAQ